MAERKGRTMADQADHTESAPAPIDVRGPCVSCGEGLGEYNIDRVCGPCAAWVEGRFAGR